MRIHTLRATHDIQIDEWVRLSRDANRFSSDISVEYEQEGTVYSIDVKSVLGTILIAIHRGMEITVRTKGRDEEEAIDWICDELEKEVQK